jgi:hypothetical protein
MVHERCRDMHGGNGRLAEPPRNRLSNEVAHQLFVDHSTSR